MKSKFLRSTALVTAGVLLGGGYLVHSADSAFAQGRGKKPKITVHGFIKQEIGFSQQDEEVVGDSATVDEQPDSEIHFKFKTKLDNGITIDGRWELEGFTTSDVIDEIYMRITGKFGRIILGSENSVAHDLSIDPRTVGLSITDGNEWITQSMSNISSSGDSPIEDEDLRFEDNDSEKISYYTPTFAGLRLGVSYVPNAEQDMNASVAASDSEYANGIALAGMYKRKIDKVRFGIAAGYMTWLDRPDNPALTVDVERPKGWVLSGEVGYGPINVRAVLQKVKGLFDNTGTQFSDSQDGMGISVGGHYKAGRNEFSLTWHMGEDEGDPTIAAANESDIVVGSVRHTLGPGVRVYASALYVDWRGEDPGSTDDNNGWALVSGIRLDF